MKRENKIVQLLPDAFSSGLLCCIKKDDAWGMMSKPELKVTVQIWWIAVVSVGCVLQSSPASAHCPLTTAELERNSL